MKELAIKNYISDGKFAEKFKAQIMLEMHMCKKKKGPLCVVSPQFEVNKNVTIIDVTYEKDYIKTKIRKAEFFCKRFFFCLWFASQWIFLGSYFCTTFEFL